MEGGRGSRCHVTSSASVFQFPGLSPGAIGGPSLQNLLLTITFWERVGCMVRGCTIKALQSATCYLQKNRLPFCYDTRPTGRTIHNALALYVAWLPCLGWGN